MSAPPVIADLHTPLTRSHWQPQRHRPVPAISIGDLLRAAAQQRPDGLALLDATVVGAEPRSWTFAELLEHSMDQARWLSTFLEPGENVALWSDNRAEWILGAYGAALAGLTVVTVNPALGPEETAHIVRTSGAAALLVGPPYRGRDLRAIAERLVGELSTLRIVSGLVATAESPRASGDEMPPVAGDALAQIQFTSGSTGRPKAAMIAHSPICAISEWVMAGMGIGPGDVYVNPSPLFHTGGGVIGSLGPLAVGATQVLAAPEPSHLLAMIERYAAAGMTAVPTVLMRMLDELDVAPRDVSSMRVLLTGSMSVPELLVDRAEARFTCSVVVGYGMTELSSNFTLGVPTDPLELRRRTVGRVLPQMEGMIADLGDRLAAPIGVEGEICARGFAVTPGYVGDPDATARLVDADGWLRTGDLGRMDAQGYIEVTGRMSDLIIRGGENIYPREVEAAVLSTGAGCFSAAYVVGVPDGSFGEVPVVAVVPVPGSTAEGQAHARRALATTLARYKQPAQWYLLERPPLRDTSKVDKGAIRAMILDGSLPELLDQHAEPLRGNG